MLSETIAKYVARGIRHQAISSRTIPEDNYALFAIANKTLSLIANRLFDLDPHERRLFSQLSVYFDGDNTPVDLVEATRLCDEALSLFCDWPALIAAVSVSRALFQNERAVWTYELSEDSAKASFCNMDLLWEQGVYTILQDIFTSPPLAAIFHPYSRSKFPLLGDGDRTIDPDIVLFDCDSAAIVVDAKYSTRTEASPDDIYQMLAYGRSLGARKGVLVYLSTGAAWRESIGSDGSFKLSAVGIPIDDVRKGGAHILTPLIRE